MSTITRAPLARHLAAAAIAGALVLAPSTAAVADLSPSPIDTSSATGTPIASEVPTTTAAPSATEATATSAAPTTTSPSTTSPSTSTAPTTTSTPSATEEAPGNEPQTQPRLVPGGTTRAFGPAAATGPTTSTDSTLMGAHYLQQRLIDTDYLLSTPFGADYGLTADTILALNAAGTGQEAAAAATARLAEDPVAYTGFGDPTEVYAGAVSKLLNVAVAQGVDPTSFGEVNLVATLTGLEDADGRFRDVSAWGDYSNTFGQSLALIGLHRAGAGPDAKAVSFLQAQQCPNGGFQLGMGVKGCTDDSLAGPDSTSMAVQALIAVGGDPSIINDGLDYLASQQQADGGVGGSGPTSATNANSTGLAGQAFLAGGRSAQARLAVAYLTPLQYGCGFPAVLRGGIAYSPEALQDQKAAGNEALPSDQDTRSSSQALLALAGTPLGTVTANGSDAGAPEPECDVPTQTPTTTTTTTTTTTQSPTTTPTQSPTATPSPTPTVNPSPSDSSNGGGTPTSGNGSDGSTPTGSLAQTGSDLLLPVGLGTLLVVLGAAAVLASRRRRAHS